MSKIKRIISLVLLAFLLCSVPLAGVSEASAKQRRSTYHSRPYHRSSHRYYTNSRGHRVHSPVYSKTIPAGATAECSDGSYSFSESRRGTCSHHGGVRRWLR